MSFNVLIELKKLSTAISSACTECWLEDLLQDSVEKIEADASEIAALKTELTKSTDDRVMLHAENVSLKADVAAGRREIHRLNGRVSDLLADIDRLKEDNEVLKGFVERNK